MKPIIFSADMVRAILEGRKTMTRRVIKPQPPETMQRKDLLGFICSSKEQPCLHMDKKYWRYGAPWGDGPNLAAPFPNPRYQPGDILWVREAWATEATIDSWLDGINLYIYRVDYDKPVPWKWRSPIYMPREAARLFLEVKSARAERVQAITEEDATAEGMSKTLVDGVTFISAKGKFHALWDSINAKRGYPYDANPWVWVIEFERTEAPL